MIWHTANQQQNTFYVRVQKKNQKKTNTKQRLVHMYIIGLNNVVNLICSYIVLRKIHSYEELITVICTEITW